MYLEDSYLNILKECSIWLEKQITLVLWFFVANITLQHVLNGFKQC